MTAVFKVPLKGGDPSVLYEIEISRDGELFIRNYDIEYDRAMLEFGEPKTLPLQLLDLWNASHGGRVQVIDQWLSIKPKRLRSLGADWAEHVMDIYKRFSPMDQGLPDALALIHRSIKTDGKQASSVDMALSKARTICDALLRELATHWEMYSDIFTAPNHALHAMHEMTRIEVSLSMVAMAAAEARAYSRGSRLFASAWDKGQKEERDWQIRRFHDVAVAWRNRKPWPPLKATP